MNTLWTYIIIYQYWLTIVVVQSCPTLCDPVDMPAFPVLHYLPKFAQTHVHWVGDAIQSSHPLSSSYPPAFNPSQLQGLFQWIGSLDQVAKVLELQHQSFQWIFRLDFLWGFWRLWSLCCPKDSQESSPAPQFESINFSAFSLFYGPTLTSIRGYWKNHSFDWMNLCRKVMSLLFNMLSRFVIVFLPRNIFFNFMGAISVHSDFRA